MFILFGVALLFSGCGSWFIVPFLFQPSYWEFKKLCELNNLPNGYEKYNKMLAYFNMSIDDIDWGKINEGRFFCVNMDTRTVCQVCVNIWQRLRGNKLMIDLKQMFGFIVINMT